LGRSRGGFTCKIHLVCDRNGIPLGVALSGGQRSDHAFVEQALDDVSIPQRRGRPRTRPELLMADKGYDSRAFRQYLRSRGIGSNIPMRALPEGKKRRQRGPKPGFDRKLYKERNIIERLIGWLKQCRRIATRYEKNANAFLAMIKVAFIRFYLCKCL
jgi:transposase